MSAHRLLTKSRFKLAVQCPTKLYYTDKKEYANRNAGDEFLKALAEGGFQVGELAKLMHPEGIEVTESDQEAQVLRTCELLRRSDVTIFEGTIRHGDLLARVDILRKRGNHVEIIEVKAKSFDSTDPETFRGKRAAIRTDMLPYLQDVAFQRHVFTRSYPEFSVTCHLMMADKSKTCTVDGLNQLFRIRRVEGKPVVEVSPAARAGGIGGPILTVADVDEYVQEILSTPLDAPGAPAGAGLPELAQAWALAYKSDQQIAPAPGLHCGSCEFRTDDKTLRSGFHECWGKHFRRSPEDIDRGTVLDLWNFQGKQRLMKQGVITLADVTPEHLALGPSPGRGLSRADRQWRQVVHAKGEADGFFVDAALLRDEMAKWRYPLHLIDFETARVALPFFAGQKPYANIAFQYSHHVIEADGRVEHKNEFLQTMPGQHPNYDFVRDLRVALGSAGTVFMWSSHENTTLKAIGAELNADPNPPADANTLLAFIDSLVRGGHREMVDLCKLAERAFFHPATHGSCSIKKVLPAVLQSSEYLRRRYSEPIYGADGGIPSRNFNRKVWWQQRDGAVCDPYSLLAPLFEDLDPRQLEDHEEGFGDIRQGGAATTAYARLQFDNIPAAQRGEVERGLKRYCELDTLAMVMIVEAWREEIRVHAAGTGGVFHGVPSPR